MKDQSRRSMHQVEIADHLWDTFSLMAEQMGSEREALINQALFTFARLNGFLEAGRPAVSAPPEEPAVRAPSAPLAHSGPPVATPLPAPAPVRAVREEHTPRPQTAPSRSAPTQPPFPEPGSDEGGEVESPDADERSQEAAAELERMMAARAQKPAHVPLPAPRLQKPVDSADGDLHLYLMTEGGELDKITKERFVIGRGKHCDFVINSGKVSREHAVIVREGDAFFIEDLGSSNGTWFNKQRIKRRKIEEGDEYFVCNEKIKLVLR
jgi:hypothetical protein